MDQLTILKTAEDIAGLEPDDVICWVRPRHHGLRLSDRWRVVKTTAQRVYVERLLKENRWPSYSEHLVRGHDQPFIEKGRLLVVATGLEKVVIKNPAPTMFDKVRREVDRLNATVEDVQSKAAEECTKARDGVLEMIDGAGR